MAEEIVFLAAKCHKSHLKAQKGAALFLPNLLKLICAGDTCEKQNNLLSPPRRRVSGLCEGQNPRVGIPAQGFRSVHLLAEKTEDEKENLAGACQPGGSKDCAGRPPPPLVPNTDGAEMAPSALTGPSPLLCTRRCASLLPHARLGPGRARKREKEAAIDLSRRGPGCTTRRNSTEPGRGLRGSAAQPKSSRKLPSDHRSRPQGWRAEACSERVRAERAARGSRASPRGGS